MDKFTGLPRGRAHKLGRLKRVVNEDDDVISVILEDHRLLKELLRVMRDTNRSLGERSLACAEFTPLLLLHSRAEEQSLYEFMKVVESLRIYAFDGDSQHELADQLCEEIRRCVDNDKLGAKIKLLADIVLRHLEEEEDKILPEVERQINEKILIQMTKRYVEIQSEIITQGLDDSIIDCDPADNIKH